MATPLKKPAKLTPRALPVDPKRSTGSKTGGRPKVDKSTQGADMKARINALNNSPEAKSYRTGKPIPTAKPKTAPATSKRPTTGDFAPGRKMRPSVPKTPSAKTPSARAVERANPNASFKRPDSGTAQPRAFTPRTRAIIDDTANQMQPRTNRVTPVSNRKGMGG